MFSCTFFWSQMLMDAQQMLSLLSCRSLEKASMAQAVLRPVSFLVCPTLLVFLAMSISLSFVFILCLSLLLSLLVFHLSVSLYTSLHLYLCFFFFFFPDSVPLPLVLSPSVSFYESLNFSYSFKCSLLDYIWHSLLGLPGVAMTLYINIF